MTKIIIANVYTPNSPEEVFVINTVLWTYFISNVNGEESFERFMKKHCKKQCYLLH